MERQPIYEMNRGFAFFVKNPNLKALRQQFQTGKKFCGRFSPIAPLFFRCGIKFFHRAFVNVRLARDDSFPQFMFNGVHPAGAKKIFAMVADGLSKNSSDCDLFIRQMPSAIAFDFCRHIKLILFQKPQVVFVKEAVEPVKDDFHSVTILIWRG